MIDLLVWKLHTDSIWELNRGPLAYTSSTLQNKARGLPNKLEQVEMPYY